MYSDYVYTILASFPGSSEGESLLRQRKSLGTRLIQYICLYCSHKNLRFPNFIVNKTFGMYMYMYVRMNVKYNTLTTTCSVPFVTLPCFHTLVCTETVHWNAPLPHKLTYKYMNCSQLQCAPDCTGFVSPSSGLSTGPTS